jgi:hypothetical protein
MTRYLRILAALLIPPLLISAGPADDGRWYAGAYSFSDELGGFSILSVTGSGTAADPIEISQALDSANPVTLVIRTAGKAERQALPEWGLHLRVVARNNSGLAWIEFEFELQEIRGKASDFYDGLSFDQIAPNPAFISSNRFTSFKSNFESFDRLRFTNGHVDPRDRPVFGFFITDVTPVDQFYLVQDPRIPSS